MAGGESAFQRNKIVLTPRDYSILMFVAENRFVTANDIRQRFWSVKTTHNHSTRLRKLVRAGLLEHLIGDNSCRLGFRLTLSGINYLPSELYKAKALSNRSFSYKTSFDHDQVVHSLRGVFEESPLVTRYIPEHELKSLLELRHGRKATDGGYKIPDATFDLKTPRKIIKAALEFEKSMKAIAVYRRIFRLHYTSSDYDVVLNVVLSEQMKRALSTIANEVSANDPVVKGWPNRCGLYFATLETVLRERRNALFEGDGEPFSLASLESWFVQKATASTLLQP